MLVNTHELFSRHHFVGFTNFTNKYLVHNHIYLKHKKYYEKKYHNYITYDPNP